MTIHSMPNNKNFDANYDGIFKKDKVYGTLNRYKEVDYGPPRTMYLGLARNEMENTWEWYGVPNTGSDLMSVPGVYTIKHDTLDNGRDSYTLHFPRGHSHTMHKQAVEELVEALECCGRYGGRYAL